MKFHFQNEHPKTPGALFDRAHLARGFGGQSFGATEVEFPLSFGIASTQYRYSNSN